MNILKKAINKVKNAIAKKDAEYLNASQQKFFADQRAAALKNLFDPKAKLSGAMKRRLLAQTGRPLDPVEGYTHTPPKPAAEKWFGRIVRLNIRQLARRQTRAAHRMNGVQIAYDKAGPRQKRLLKPRLDFANMLNTVIGEVITFRAMPKMPTK